LATDILSVGRRLSLGRSLWQADENCDHGEHIGEQSVGIAAALKTAGKPSSHQSKRKTTKTEMRRASAIKNPSCVGIILA
jgi:hypothetical protein